MNDFLEMVNASAWALWAVVGLVSLWFSRRAGWGWFAAGFFLLALAWAPLGLHWGAGLAETAAILCFLMGAVAMKLAGGAAVVGTEVRSNPYFSTDELIARAAAQRTVNEDVEFIKKHGSRRWQPSPRKTPNKRSCAAARTSAGPFGWSATPTWTSSRAWNAARCAR